MFDLKKLFPGVNFNKYKKIVEKLELGPCEFILDPDNPAIYVISNGNMYTFLQLDVMLANKGFSEDPETKLSQILTNYEMTECRSCGIKINQRDCYWKNTQDSDECSELGISCHKCNLEIFFSYTKSIKEFDQFLDQLAFLLDRQVKDENWHKI